MLSKNKEEDADEQENRELKKNDKAAGEQRASAILLVFGGQQPLHDGLIRAVTGHGQESSANHAGPARVFGREIPAEIEDLQLVSMRRRDLHDFVPSAGNAVEQDSEGNQASSQVEKKLGDVGPDDRFHAAFKCVEDGQRNNDKDRQPLRGSQRNTNNQCDRCDAHSFGECARSKECSRGNGAHTLTKSLFHYRISGQKFASKITRQKKHGDQETPGKITEDELEKRHIAAVSERGRSDDGKGGSFRRHNGKGQRPPGSCAPSQKVVAHIVLFFSKLDAQSGHAQQVNNDDGQINRMNTHRLRTSPLPVLGEV